MGNQQSAILVKDWLARWLDEKVRPARKTNTQERYEGIIRRQIVPYLGDVELVALTPTAIDSMQSELLRSGLAASTVRNAHTILSAACKEAVRMGLTDHNPVASVAPPVKRHRRIIPPAVARRFRLCCASPATKEHTLYPFLHLLVYTGMRRG